ncbi:DNA adenine methylase [Pseudovibrio sp. WM33]|uniref:DNA adenine methylase n=1 Tax=Pseudovibrio sp. WM33 TaxID=1735585 RepID=UPI0007B20D22|nr:DNA adenine methylase [Pseudovibrio sp. WM33]KZL17603.1 Modification methylase FokI [Pseudovibrio sp. WM33]
MLQVPVSDHYLIHRDYPSLIKYMGSKSKIMDFVLEGINQVHDKRAICDLFAGSASLAGAVGQQCVVHSNDIQHYSSVLSDTYNKAFKTASTPSADQLIEAAQRIVETNDLRLEVNYSDANSLEKFNDLEELQRGLINQDFSYEWCIFAKNYSGTWWSYEQCLWIDAFRQVAEDYKDTAIYPVILSSLMFGMAYASQGTGHYAQYRNAKTQSSLRDILIYRNRSIQSYFHRKYNDLLSYIPGMPVQLSHKSTALDYRECLANFEGGTVYADPPYCFVHYSRFYHALETLVLYDFPTLQVQRGRIVKGRYRESRHQSPFCIKTQVPGAFVDLFTGVKQTDSKMVLSYSNTGMITIEELYGICKEVLPNKKMDLLTTDHKHMTLGRREDRQRDVKECLLLIY